MTTDPLKAIAFAEAVARMTTWREHCESEAVEDYGLETPEEIAEHVRSAQADLEYLIGQDEALESLIAQARAIVTQA